MTSMTKQVFRKALSMITILCYVLIFGFLLLISPIVAGYHPVIVQSPSMQPAIKTGSIVYYKSVDTIAQLSMGDVITFKQEGDGPMITHRLMRINDDGTIKTMGDNNPSLDSWDITFENIVGKVGSVYIPKCGFYMAFAQNPAVIFVVASIIVLNVVIKPVKEKEGIAK